MLVDSFSRSINLFQFFSVQNFMSHLMSTLKEFLHRRKKFKCFLAYGIYLFYDQYNNFIKKKNI